MLWVFKAQFVSYLADRLTRCKDLILSQVLKLG
jgi:hypothetical protein